MKLRFRVVLQRLAVLRTNGASARRGYWLYGVLFGVVVFACGGAVSIAEEASEPFMFDQAELDAAVGRPVISISFVDPTNRSMKELRRSLVFTEGDILLRDSLTESVRRLYQRRIYRHIDVRVTSRSEGIELRFVLVPRMIVSLVEFRGHYTLKEAELRRLSRIRSGDRLSTSALLEAKSRILDGYRRAGHRQASVVLRVEEQSVPQWVTVAFEISENYRSTITKVEFKTVLPDDLRSIRRRLELDALGLPASVENVERLKRDLLLAVRREGYLQASIRDGELSFDESGGDASLEFSGEVRQPISINFIGNTILSAAELLAPLRMESRSVPFTPSALLTLSRSIERLYQERGYYFATTKTEKLGIERGRQIYQIEVEERKPFRIRRVSFVGNQSFADETLQEFVVTSRSGWWLFRRWTPGFLVKEELAEDTERLRQYFLLRGFLDVEVVSDVVVDHKRSTFDVVFRISEGEQQKIQSVDLELSNVLGGESPAIDQTFSSEQDAEGFGSLDADLLLIRSTVKIGQPFDRDVLREEQRRLYSEVVALGYPSAAVELQGDAKLGQVRYKIVPRQRVKIGEVVLQGNSLTRDFVLSRELQFKTGDFWSTDVLERSKQNLSGLGFFRSVEIGPLDGDLDEAVEDIVVGVDERETGRLGIGGSFTSEDGFNLYGELGQRNLFGRGMRFLLGVDTYIKTGERVFDAGRVRASFTRPRVYRTSTDLSTDVFLQSMVKLIDQFSYDRLGAEVNLATPWDEDTRSVVGFVGFTERVFDVEPDVILGENDTGQTFYTFAKSSIDFDHRDNRYNPRKGFRTQLDARLASKAIASEVNLARFTFQQSMLVPIRRRFVWANRFVAELAEPFGGTEVVPLSQRIFLGGRNSLRGFSRDSVGPRGFELNVVGGDFGVNGSTELRYDVAESLTGVVFLDAGQAYLRNKGSFTGDSLDESDLRFSPGFGAHYQTPIGPIRGEYAIALDREFDERFGRINVSIGTGF